MGRAKEEKKSQGESGDGLDVYANGYFFHMSKLVVKFYSNQFAVQPRKDYDSPSTTLLPLALFLCP